MSLFDEQVLSDAPGEPPSFAIERRRLSALDRRARRIDWRSLVYASGPIEVNGLSEAERAELDRVFGEEHADD